MAGPSPRSKKKQDVKKLLAGAQRPVRTVSVCLRADLADEHEAIEARLAKAREDDSLGGHPDVPGLEARLAELRGEMAESSLEFRVRGLSERQFTALIAKYPARAGDKRDEFVGFNLDDVVEQLLRLGTEDPDMDDEDWQTLLESVNHATWDQLVTAAWAVNKVDVSIPF